VQHINPKSINQIRWRRNPEKLILSLTAVGLSNFTEHRKMERNIIGTGTEGTSKGTTIIGIVSERVKVLIRLDVLRDIKK
jgi:hypothetical protein